MRDHGRRRWQSFLAVQQRGEAETVLGFFRHRQKFIADDDRPFQTDCTGREHVYRDEYRIQAFDIGASAGHQRESDLMRAGEKEHGTVYRLCDSSYPGVM